MLTYSFEDITESLYEHLYKCIKADINSGKLPADFHLPSKRAFSRNLNVSIITIENAYSQLMSEGYIYSLPKRGYFVSDISSIYKIKKKSQVELNIHLPKKEKFFEVDLSNNQTKADNFPFSVWARLLRDAISNHSEELMIPSPCGGILQLRQAISSYLASFRGMSVDPNQIVLGAGTEYLYGLLIQLLGRNKKYCLENPGYHKISKIYSANNVSFSYANLDEMGISVDDLKKSESEIAHISPTHHFPTGITIPATRRYELLAWANEKSGRYIIEDDYDSEFRFSGKPIPTLFSIDDCGKVIYVNTFSKSLASTIRISYMILPVELANKFYEKMSFYSCTVSNFEQYTLSEFIKNGFFEKHINRMRLFYSRQRQLVMDCINSSELSKKCRISEKDSGLHFILEFDTDFSDSELCSRFEEKGIHISPVSDFYVNKDSAPEHKFILNYSNIDVFSLAKALVIMSQCITH